MEKRSHRIGKFNILSVNVILFQGNQKNIMVGLSGRNNADSGLFTKKIRAISGLSGRLKAHGCFPPKPIIGEIYVEFGAFSYQICCGSKNFVFGLMEGKFGKLSLYAFIVRVADAPADHESTSE